MDQRKTPLFDALQRYSTQQKYSFHVPGHKDGLTFFGKGNSFYKELLQIDATEVEGLDDFYHPTGPIAEAHELLKDFYSTVKSYFLVNGSTVGNLAMVRAACCPGDTVLVQRNSHKSIFNALKLARVKPVFLPAEYDEHSRTAVGPSLSVVNQALASYPGAKALILTYPNYYGIAGDVKEMIEHARKKGLLILVDEAHGSHFKLGPPFPKSTLEMGADIVVHSAHKTLPAMTMGSYLHLNSSRIPAEALETELAILQTSSPSYPIMASLDLARAFLATLNKEKLNRIMEKINGFKKALDDIKGIHTVQSTRYAMDPLKLLIATVGYPSGFKLQDRLQNLGLYPEMADPHNVLLVLALDEHTPYDQLLHVIQQGLQQKYPICYPKNFEVLNDGPSESLSTRAFDYDDAIGLSQERLPLCKALGRVAAQMVIPYPPGVPLILEGERITKDHLTSFLQWKEAGARFQGYDERDTKATIAVYKK